MDFNLHLFPSMVPAPWAESEHSFLNCWVFRLGFLQNASPPSMPHVRLRARSLPGCQQLLSQPLASPCGWTYLKSWAGSPGQSTRSLGPHWSLPVRGAQEPQVLRFWQDTALPTWGWVPSVASMKAKLQAAWVGPAGRWMPFTAKCPQPRIPKPPDPLFKTPLQIINNIVNCTCVTRTVWYNLTYINIRQPKVCSSPWKAALLPLLPSPRQPLIFPPLQIRFHFLEFHMNGTIQDTLFFFLDSGTQHNEFEMYHVTAHLNSLLLYCGVEFHRRLCWFVYSFLCW